jgi:hypothetical protein
VRQAGEQGDVVGPQLGRRPRGHRVGDGRAAAARERDQLAVRVPTDQERPLTQGSQAVQHRDGLWPGGVVTGDDHAVRGHHIGFREHCLQHRKYPVDVRQDRYGTDLAAHEPTLARTAARRHPRRDAIKVCDQQNGGHGTLPAPSALP